VSECNINYFLDFFAGDLIASIKHNSYTLIGVHKNELDYEIQKIEDWKSVIKEELESNFTRRIPSGQNYGLDYSKNQSVNDFGYNYKSACKFFLELLEDNLLNDLSEFYVVTVNKSRQFDRIVGVDLVFEIAPTKMLYLQLMGTD